MVGDEMRRGISGGQKKRVTTGMSPCGHLCNIRIQSNLKVNYCDTFYKTDVYLSLFHSMQEKCWLVQQKCF